MEVVEVIHKGGIPGFNTGGGALTGAPVSLRSGVGDTNIGGLIIGDDKKSDYIAWGVGGLVMLGVLAAVLKMKG